MSEQERLERAAVQLAWEISTLQNQARWVVPFNVWRSMTEHRRKRCRRMAAVILAAADAHDVGAP
jgi:uncharacterized protein (DUF934 family)